MANLIKRFVREEEGATMVEYGLLVALIAIACVGALTALSDDLKLLFTNITTALHTAS